MYWLCRIHSLRFNQHTMSMWRGRSLVRTNHILFLSHILRVGSLECTRIFHLTLQPRTCVKTRITITRTPSPMPVHMELHFALALPEFTSFNNYECSEELALTLRKCSINWWYTSVLLGKQLCKQSGGRWWSGRRMLISYASRIW
jgi:hypothetical protein